MLRRDLPGGGRRDEDVVVRLVERARHACLSHQLAVDVAQISVDVSTSSLRAGPTRAARRRSSGRTTESSIGGPEASSQPSGGRCRARTAPAGRPAAAAGDDDVLAGLDVGEQLDSCVLASWTFTVLVISTNLVRNGADHVGVRRHLPRVAVFVIAAVVVGREAHRLDAVAPRVVYRVDEAVDFVADRVPPATPGAAHAGRGRAAARVPPALAARQGAAARRRDRPPPGHRRPRRSSTRTRSSATCSARPSGRASSCSTTSTRWRSSRPTSPTSTRSAPSVRPPRSGRRRLTAPLAPRSGTMAGN